MNSTSFSDGNDKTSAWDMVEQAAVLFCRFLVPAPDVCLAKGGAVWAAICCQWERHCIYTCGHLTLHSQSAWRHLSVIYIFYRAQHPAACWVQCQFNRLFQQSVIAGELIGQLWNNGGYYTWNGIQSIWYGKRWSGAYILSKLRLIVQLKFDSSFQVCKQSIYIYLGCLSPNVDKVDEIDWTRSKSKLN